MSTPADMKPADQTLFLLGQIDGKLGSLQQSVESTFATQAGLNAANLLEHARMEKHINDVANELTGVKAAIGPKVAPITVVVGVIAVAAFGLTLFDRLYIP